MRRLGRILIIAGALAGAGLSGCTVWSVNRDPDGMHYRGEANRILFALQDYHRRTGGFPARLGELVPTYLPALPDVPRLQYDARRGSLSYRYIPTFPQLRPVWCASVGDTTEWRCAEHLT